MTRVAQRVQDAGTRLTIEIASDLPSEILQPLVLARGRHRWSTSSPSGNSSANLGCSSTSHTGCPSERTRLKTSSRTPEETRAARRRHWTRFLTIYPWYSPPRSAVQQRGTSRFNRTSRVRSPFSTSGLPRTRDLFPLPEKTQGHASRTRSSSVVLVHARGNVRDVRVHGGSSRRCLQWNRGSFHGYGLHANAACHADFYRAWTHRGLGVRLGHAGARRLRAPRNWKRTRSRSLARARQSPSRDTSRPRGCLHRWRDCTTNMLHVPVRAVVVVSPAVHAVGACLVPNVLRATVFLPFHLMRTAMQATRAQRWEVMHDPRAHHGLPRLAATRTGRQLLAHGLLAVPRTRPRRRRRTRSSLPVHATCRALSSVPNVQIHVKPNAGTHRPPRPGRRVHVRRVLPTPRRDALLRRVSVFSPGAREQCRA